MPSTLAQKLRIKDGFVLLAINSPGDFKKKLNIKNVTITSSGKNFDQIHWFVQSRAGMEKELPDVLKKLKEDMLCWIYYPKGSSKIQTDLSRDKGWDQLLKIKELQWISLISFDDTWSAFAIRKNSKTDVKEEKPKEKSAIFDYIDAKNKTIRLPDDFESELNKKKKQQEFFNQLSFTNKKEYIEWIVSAKKEETRQTRVKESIERLTKEWKNPSNR
jgi:hypothetical protein